MLDNRSQTFKAQYQEWRTRLITIISNNFHAEIKADDRTVFNRDRFRLKARNKFRDQVPEDCRYVRFWSGLIYVGSDTTTMYKLDELTAEQLVEMLESMEKRHYKVTDSF